MGGRSGCDFCTFYTYDEQYDCYCCEINLDEDEYARFVSGTNYNCPYFQPDDEYSIVRKQN